MLMAPWWVVFSVIMMVRKSGRRNQRWPRDSTFILFFHSYSFSLCLIAMSNYRTLLGIFSLISFYINLFLNVFFPALLIGCILQWSYLNECSVSVFYVLTLWLNIQVDFICTMNRSCTRTSIAQVKWLSLR